MFFFSLPFTSEGDTLHSGKGILAKTGPRRGKGGGGGRTGGIGEERLGKMKDNELRGRRKTIRER